MPALNGWPPRWLTSTPDSTRGEFACEFIEAFCRITKDSVGGRAGELLRLRPFQRNLIGGLLAERPDGRLKHRSALIGMPRKNGKSGIGSGIALWSLVTGPGGGEVYSAAGDKKQARIVFEDAKRMVKMDPDLDDIITCYRDVLEVPATGSIYRVLAADADLQEGLNPTLVVFDEVHVQPNRELWDVLALAQGSRDEPLMLGITTAGTKTDSTGEDSVCYWLYQHGVRVASGEVDDPSFYFAWWEPSKVDCDDMDPAVWCEANPGFGDIVSEDDFRAVMAKTPENVRRTKRLNQFVSTLAAWLPAGSWDRCADVTDRLAPGDTVYLGFDGSYNNDSTALVAVRPSGVVEDAEGPVVHELPHVEVIELWEKRPEDGDDWTVSILAVEQAIRDACERFNVVEIVCDPARWARTYQALDDEGLPIVKYPQSAERMMPATQRFFEAVVNGGMSHDGDLRLARHVANCTVAVDARGQRIRKDKKHSKRKIDLAVSAVMAFDRAETPGEVDEGVQVW